MPSSTPRLANATTWPTIRPTRPRARAGRARSASLALAAALILAGCAVGPDLPPTIPTDGPTQRCGVQGDPDDVSRALRVAVEAVQGAVLDERWNATPAGQAFDAQLLLIESRQAEAKAWLAQDGSLCLSAYVLPAGDRHTQDALLDAWARRLGQLHGVDWAPR